MASSRLGARLTQPVDNGYDHILGSPAAEITLVEYGSYDCPHCRAANDRIAEVRDQFGGRLRYVFRHRPVTGSALARRAAELVECCVDHDQFWNAHVALMTRSASLTEEDLAAVAKDFGLPEPETAPETVPETQSADERARRARERVEQDMASAHASGVMFTPTFFINSRRYDGPWDESSFADAMLGSLGHRVRSAALDFASWAPSTGLLLLFASIAAVALTNTTLGPAFEAIWLREFSLGFGDASFSMSLRHWVNDGLLTLFFLVVGLEIKREFTVGHLASRRSAALPIAGAIGGMTVPVLLYLLVAWQGPWAHGWGVPMATDTAFAVALIIMLGERVPVELRIFLTAAAIVDDIGAIIVVALFYANELNLVYLGLAVAATAGLAALNRSSVYRVLPYAALGVILWICVHGSGLHATLTGVLLALFIPTRPPPDLRTLIIQADIIVQAELRHRGQVLHRGPSLETLRQLDAIHDRLESPADRTLRHAEPWSSYAVLPLFALANAGVMIGSEAIMSREPLMLAIMLGLVVGKPVGFVLAAFVAVKLGAAIKPAEYSWRQLAGAGALAGIGFTMSLFIAGQAFPAAGDFAAAKIAVFTASVISAVIGVAILWCGRHDAAEDSTGEAEPSSGSAASAGANS